MQTKPAIFFLTVFLTVLLFLPLIHPAFATTIFSDGFESGNFSAWTGTTTSGSGAITVVSEQAHHGTYSAKSYKPDSTSSGFVYKDITSSPIVYSRFYLYVSSWTAGSGVYDAIFAVRNVAPATAFILMLKESTRYLYIRYESGGANYLVQSSTTVPLNTWICLEVEYDKTNGEYRVYKDGSEVTDLTQTGKSISYNAGSVQFGFRNYGTAYGTVYLDCVVVADTYIGPETAAQEYSFTLTETVKPTSTPDILQEHTYTFTGTIIQSSILSYSVEGIQEFIETLTQTVTSSGTTYYWMELSYALTETAKPTAIHSIGLEGIFTLIQTITPTETRIILQEQLYTFPQTTTLQTTLTYAGELAEAFITNIETITLQETIQYWIQRVELPINWGLVALCASILAFSLATAAIASQKTSESD